MKILQVLFSGLGGHGSVAFSLVRGDRERAHRHAMLFYGIEGLAPGYADACERLGVEFRVVAKRRGLDGRSWLQAARATVALKPDVIVLHSMSLITPMALLSRALRVPLVAVDHLSNQVKRTKDWGMTATALAVADKVVFLTTPFAAEVKERLRALYRDRRVAVIGNGIDVEQFSMRTRRTSAGAIMRVGMHSRFTASKDHATLVRAVARLAEVRLVLAGDGETYSAVQRLITELGIKDRVELLGMLPEEELPGFLASLDVYVQSSLGETMSTAVMQAMASGLPVVASDVSGLREMVPAGVGELFDRGDDAALARAIDSLRDPVRRGIVGEAAQQHARRSWSQETMFRSYEAEMLELVASARCRNGQGS